MCDWVWMMLLSIFLCWLLGRFRVDSIFRLVCIVVSGVCSLWEDIVVKLCVDVSVFLVWFCLFQMCCSMLCIVLVILMVLLVLCIFMCGVLLFVLMDWVCLVSCLNGCIVNVVNSQVNIVVVLMVKVQISSIWWCRLLVLVMVVLYVVFIVIDVGLGLGIFIVCMWQCILWMQVLVQLFCSLGSVMLEFDLIMLLWWIVMRVFWLFGECGILLRLCGMNGIVKFVVLLSWWFSCFLWLLVILIQMMVLIMSIGIVVLIVVVIIIWVCSEGVWVKICDRIFMYVLLLYMQYEFDFVDGMQQFRVIVGFQFVLQVFDEDVYYVGVGGEVVVLY